MHFHTGDYLNLKPMMAHQSNSLPLSTQTANQRLAVFFPAACEMYLSMSTSYVSTLVKPIILKWPHLVSEVVVAEFLTLSSPKRAVGAIINSGRLIRQVPLE